LVVADFSRALAGPLATMTLADLGARVVKIERPGVGDDTRAWGPPYSDHGATYFESVNGATYFESVNRGKQSIALDLTDPQGRQTAFDIATHADVVIENFTAGTMDRLGLGYDAISEVNPESIFCSINGFGSAEGKDLLGYDFIVQAVGGLMSITGAADGEPTKVGVALVDVLTGKDAVTGILAAVIARGRTGRGDHLEVTLMTSLLGGLVNQGQASLETGQPGRPMGNQHPSIAVLPAATTPSSPAWRALSAHPSSPSAGSVRPIRIGSRTATHSSGISRRCSVRATSSTGSRCCARPGCRPARSTPSPKHSRWQSSSASNRPSGSGMAGPGRCGTRSAGRHTAPLTRRPHRATTGTPTRCEPGSPHRPTDPPRKALT